MSKAENIHIRISLEEKRKLKAVLALEGKTISSFLAEAISLKTKEMTAANTTAISKGE